MENEFYYLGNNDLLNDNSLKLGIVGSRAILDYTREVLEDLFYELKNFDVCIVSGGMYGVDIFSHNLALLNNLKTIVVLPQGIDSYKKSSLYSQLKIKDSSKYLFISKYSNNFTARKYTFLERNKTISEISKVLLVAQASAISGSISTANHTLKLNKKLLAVPFGLYSKQFQGTNMLIRRGAEIYLNPNSILENFGFSIENIEESIINQLKIGKQDLENLQIMTRYNSTLIQKSLLKLILEGRIFFDGEYYLV